MAETQRKTTKDQSDAQLANTKLQQDMAKHTVDNQTKIEIENAKLTHETIKTIAQAQEQAQPPVEQQPQGAPNGNV